MWKSLKQQVSDDPQVALRYLAESVGIVSFLAYFFYKSWWAVPILIPIGIHYFQNRFHGFEERKCRELDIQFQECLLSVSAGLRAGYSMENAFLESLPEMKLLFGDKSRIVLILQSLMRGMQNNISLEQQLTMLGEQSAGKIIREFAEIFGIARKTTGNLTEIIVDTVSIMTHRLRMEQEIQDIISGRKFEQKIMNLVPFFITTYIQMTNRGYFDVLYHNMKGVLFMTVCLLLYLVSCYLANKISDL